jgi:transmembrane 9 superfamily protein 3
LAFLTAPMEKKTICSLELTDDQVDVFKEAVANTYWFEFFVDDLPLWGFVGEYHPEKNDENSKYVMNTHKHFLIKYNKNQIIQVNLTQDNLQPIKAGKVLEFTYAVEWVETNTTFARRFDAYLDYPFFEHQVNPICSVPLTPSPS